MAGILDDRVILYKVHKSPRYMLSVRNSRLKRAALFICFQSFILYTLTAILYSSIGVRRSFGFFSEVLCNKFCSLYA